MALFEGFRATNIWNAFILNSIVAALVIFIAMYVKGRLDTYTDKRGHAVIRSTNATSVAVTLVSTFMASFLAYTFMHFVFDYGAGQLAD